jgi:hypothetical protein
MLCHALQLKAQLYKTAKFEDASFYITQLYPYPRACCLSPVSRHTWLGDHKTCTCYECVPRCSFKVALAQGLGGNCMGYRTSCAYMLGVARQVDTRITTYIIASKLQPNPSLYQRWGGGGKAVQHLGEGGGACTNYCPNEERAFSSPTRLQGPQSTCWALPWPSCQCKQTWLQT